MELLDHTKSTQFYADTHVRLFFHATCHHLVNPPRNPPNKRLAAELPLYGVSTAPRRRPTSCNEHETGLKHGSVKRNDSGVRNHTGDRVDSATGTPETALVARSGGMVARQG